MKRFLFFFLFRNVLIIIKNDNQVALTDFGLSRRANDGAVAETISPRWASPELFRTKNFTLETDIWAFGKYSIIIKL